MGAVPIPIGYLTRNNFVPKFKLNHMKKQIEQHKLVEEVYQDSDGWWAVLKDGYNYFGCSSIRQDTLTKLKSSLSQITIGKPY
jgi:murein L,D-transpeptidase YafK